MASATHAFLPVVPHVTWAPSALPASCVGRVPQLVSVRCVAGRTAAQQRRDRQARSRARAASTATARADGSLRLCHRSMRRAAVRLAARERAFAVIRRLLRRWLASRRPPRHWTQRLDVAAAVQAATFAEFRAGAAPPLDGDILLPPPPRSRAAYQAIWLPPAAWAGWDGIVPAAACGCAALLAGCSPPLYDAVPCGIIGEALAPIFDITAATPARVAAPLAAASPMPHPLAVQALSGLSAAAASWQPRAADAGWRAADAWACRAALASYFCAVDLGCGAGGWAVGAAAAGLPVLGGIDGCSSALRTYATNHPSHLHACEDILDVATVVRRILA